MLPVYWSKLSKVAVDTPYVLNLTPITWSFIKTVQESLKVDANKGSFDHPHCSHFSSTKVGALLREASKALMPEMLEQRNPCLWENTWGNQRSLWRCDHSSGANKTRVSTSDVNAVFAQLNFMCKRKVHDYVSKRIKFQHQSWFAKTMLSTWFETFATKVLLLIFNMLPHHVTTHFLGRLSTSSLTQAAQINHGPCLGASG